MFDAVYDAFVERLAAGVDRLDDVGPVISEESMERILAAVAAARASRRDRSPRRRARR